MSKYHSKSQKKGPIEFTEHSNKRKSILLKNNLIQLIKIYQTFGYNYTNLSVLKPFKALFSFLKIC